jgi:hypothetical protein
MEGGLTFQNGEMVIKKGGVPVSGRAPGPKPRVYEKEYRKYYGPTEKTQRSPDQEARRLKKAEAAKAKRRGAPPA